MQDIHTHLYWESYDADRDEVVKRAREGGMKEMLVIGCTVEESRQAVSIAEKYPLMYAAIGIHPHECNEGGSVATDREFHFLAELRELAQNKKVIAIGECGLDYFSHDKTKIISEEEKLWQKAVFQKQLDLAQEKSLPLIVHCRTEVGKSDAYEDVLSILEAASYRLPIILHCYMGDTEVTKKFLSLPNVHFSFTGNITYPVKKTFVGTKDDLTETVKLIPLDRLFVETDCPFLSPQSKRGERNEPFFMRETLECIANLQQQEVTVIEHAIEENFKKVFNV